MISYIKSSVSFATFFADCSVLTGCCAAGAFAINLAAAVIADMVAVAGAVRTDALCHTTTLITDVV